MMKSLLNAKAILDVAFYFITYLLWTWTFRLLVLTLYAYYWKNTNVSIAEMSEAFHSIELNVFSIGVFLYVLLLKNLNPLIIFSFSEVFSNYRFEKAYITSFFIGSSISLGTTIALLFIGFYQYYGTLISFEESLFALTGIAVRVLLLCGFVYLEEFIFRRKIFNLLRQNFSNIAAIVLTTILYLAIKFYQFDIGLKHLLSLTLISISLCLRALKKEDFCYGAGILSGILVFFHPISSLPIFGYELPGLVLIKHQTTSEIIGWLTGGAGGPLSSLILQIIFILDIVVLLLSGKKEDWRLFFKKQ